MDTLQTSSIKIGNRARKQLGDLSALADSIAKLGLLQAIVVDTEHRLICGHRRFEACSKLLGWTQIDARVVETGAETLDALLMERDENDQRKPFTPSEAIAMKELIEDKFRAEAKARQSAAGGNVSQKSNAPCQLARSENGLAMDQIAEAVGMKPQTMRRVEKVIRQGIPALVEAMDNGEISPSAAVYVANLPQEEQEHAAQKGLAGFKAVAKEGLKQERLQREQRKAEKTAEATQPVAIPENQTPQMGALVLRARIMAALDGMIASDPNATIVLQEVKTRCETMMARFDKETSSE